MIFKSNGLAFVPSRDDINVPQFLLDNVDPHFTRPVRPAHVPCLIDEDSGKAMYLTEIQQRTHLLARVFQAKWNIGAGDIVSLYSPNHIDYCVLVWAIHRLGGTVALHSPSLTSEELVYQLRITQPTVLVVHSEIVQVALDAMKKVDISRDRLVLLDGPLTSDASITSITSFYDLKEASHGYSEHKLKAGEGKTAIAFLCFSSGTTGNPKAVSISHYNVISCIIQGATYDRLEGSHEGIRFRPGDICSGVLPFYHIYGMVSNLHRPMYIGMTLVVSRFNFENLLRSIERYRITHLMIVPPQAVLFCKHPSTKKYDLSGVRFCMVGAAPISAELTKQLLGVFPGIYLGQGYGMTETSPNISMFPPTQRVGTLGSAGQLVPGTTAKVLKADGTFAGVGERGELYVKGPQVALGYYKNKKATRETFIDGWVRTGDEVMFDADGNIFITDRIKELIKVKGSQVAPSELEGYLLDDTDVADAAVVGAPDEYAGELPFAFIVLKPELAAAVKGDAHLANDIRGKLYKRISSVASRYKWLDGGIEFIDAVPKSTAGKILRRILKDSIKKSNAPARSRL